MSRNLRATGEHTESRPGNVAIGSSLSLSAKDWKFVLIHLCKSLITSTYEEPGLTGILEVSYN